jgi:TonB family protein
MEYGLCHSLQATCREPILLSCTRESLPAAGHSAHLPAMPISREGSQPVVGGGSRLVPGLILAYPGGMRFALAPTLALAVVVGISPDTPARFLGGGLPIIPVLSVEVGGGAVLLEVSVDRAGAVTGVKPLRDTATFTDRLTQSVKNWRFAPAETPIAEALRKPGGPATRPVDSKVLVAGVFRPPTVMGPTFGDPIRDVAAASNDIPFPTSIVTPPFPPMVVSPGVVLVEVSVDASGRVTDAKTRIPAAGFDSAALDAARQWTFRAAKPGGVGAQAVAYIVFSFPTPASALARW